MDFSGICRIAKEPRETAHGFVMNVVFDLKKDQPRFFSAFMDNRFAKMVQYLTKGKPILIDGRVSELGSYNDKASVSINVKSIEFIPYNSNKQLSSNEIVESESIDLIKNENYF